MKQYPIGIQNFEKLRECNFFYVDKTKLIYQLVTSGKYYNLTRPRRFGKSLLLSTLQAYFEGKRELFEGLEIEKLESDWTPHPILHLDLNTQKYDTPESLDNILNKALEDWERLYGNDPAEKSLAMRFDGIIKRAHEKTGQRAVILVDEYDKPMLQAIGNDELQSAYRETLKPFYGALKSRDADIRFAFLTGVTKFGKVSVFSDLNNLNDISMWDKYYDVCGISEAELERDFREDVEALATAQGMAYDDCVARLKHMYDGYHFDAGTPGVYNPFSLLNTFAKLKFGYYWFETGTPTYLVKLLQLHNYDLNEMANEQTSEDVLNSIDAASTNPIPVIYQSGYLTIKDYDPEFELYTLGFPNEEVEKGFVRYLMPFYTTVNQGKTAFEISRFVKEIEAGDCDAFFTRLRSFYADIPYEMQRDLEVHYQNVLFIVFRLMGFHVGVEYHTSNGRVDLVLKTKARIYVMEFKFDGTAEEAMQQIDEKGYATPFTADGRQVVKVAVNFSRDTKTIDKWIVEENH